MSGRGESQQEKMAAASFAWLSVVVKRGATTLVREDSALSLSLFLLSSTYAQMLAKWLIFFSPSAGSLVKTEKSVNHFIQLVWPKCGLCSRITHTYPDITHTYPT